MEPALFTGIFFCFTDEIIRLVILGRYMIQGKWIKPVTSQGKAALEEFFG